MKFFRIRDIRGKKAFRSICVQNRPTMLRIEFRNKRKHNRVQRLFIRMLVHLNFIDLFSCYVHACFFGR